MPSWAGLTPSDCGLESSSTPESGARRCARWPPSCRSGEDQPIGLAAELFATTLDVFLTLGDLDPNPSDLATADGRGATIDAARDRLARMVGADRESFSADDAVRLSRSAAECLLHRLSQAAHRVCQATIGIADVAVVAGSGEFLARRLAGRVLGSERRVISLAEAWGCAASTAAVHRALLTLATEHENASVICTDPRGDDGLCKAGDFSQRPRGDQGGGQPAGLARAATTARRRSWTPGVVRKPVSVSGLYWLLVGDHLPT